MKKVAGDQMWIILKKLFTDEYHDLNLNQKLSVLQAGYHSTYDVVPSEEITSAFDSLDTY